MKKIIRGAALLLALILAAALFGCGGRPDPAAVTDESVSDPAPESAAAESESDGEPDEDVASLSEFVWKYDENGLLWLDAYVGGDAEVTIPKRDPETGTKIYGIDVWAFRDNDRVKKIVIPHAVKEIGKCAFMNCSSLEEVVIPNGVTAIGDQAFYRCTALKKIALPEGVKKIGYAAFMFCESLEEITLPATLEEIGTLAFSRCTSFITINYTGSYDKWNSISVESNSLPPSYNVLYDYIA